MVGVPLVPVCISGGGLFVVLLHGLSEGVQGEYPLGNGTCPTFLQSRACVFFLSPGSGR